jgi:aryl-alcohol dehydrogenase-like predicted oxidoreductase
LKYNILRGTGLTVSQLCLGTMTFGGQTGEKDSLDIIRCAVDNGINFIDTAQMYTGGQSEIIVGKGIKGDRERLVLATKVSLPESEDFNSRGLNRKHILSAIEASLKRLDTDYVDLYYMHTPDYVTPIEESLQTMDMLVRSGKVRYVAISNYASWQACDLVWTAKTKGFAPPTVTQNVYNLLTRGIEEELLPFALKHNMGVVVYNPIAGGLLTGKHKKDAPLAENTRFALNSSYMDRYIHGANFDAVEKIDEIARERGMSLLEFSMKWCAARAGVDSVITGVSKLSQLQQNIACMDGAPLDDEAFSLCDQLYRNLPSDRFKYNR